MRLVNFADGYTLEKPPLTSGSVQEECPLLDNMFNWTPITGIEFNIEEVSSADISMEIYRKFYNITYRQLIKLDVWHDGTEWRLTFGAYSGSDLIKEELGTYQDVCLRINPETGSLEYKSGYSTDANHEGDFKLATIRRKA